MVVKSELEKLGLHHIRVELGETEIMEDLTPDRSKHSDIALRKTGLELMDDKKSVLVEKIKHIIIELVHYTDDRSK